MEVIVRGTYPNQARRVPGKGEFSQREMTASPSRNHYCTWDPDAVDRSGHGGGHTRQDLEVSPTQSRISPSIQRIRRKIAAIKPTTATIPGSPRSHGGAPPARRPRVSPRLTALRRFCSSYTKLYSVIYDSGSVPDQSMFSPRETSPSTLSLPAGTTPKHEQVVNPREKNI